MLTGDDVEIARLVEEEIVEEFDEQRRELISNAKKQILKVQEENRMQYNKRRRASHQYSERDLLAIKRTQFGAGLKFFPKYMGPYEVTKVKRNDRYDVRKVGVHEGPNVTSTSADYMKSWSSGSQDNGDSSGSDEV